MRLTYFLLVFLTHFSVIIVDSFLRLIFLQFFFDQFLRDNIQRFNAIRQIYSYSATELILKHLCILDMNQCSVALCGNEEIKDMFLEQRIFKQYQILLCFRISISTRIGRASNEGPRRRVSLRYTFLCIFHFGHASLPDVWCNFSVPRCVIHQSAFRVKKTTSQQMYVSNKIRDTRKRSVFSDICRTNRFSIYRKWRGFCLRPWFSVCESPFAAAYLFEIFPCQQPADTRCVEDVGKNFH